MILIIGGFAQGKTEYVKAKYNILDENVFDAVLPKEPVPAGTVVINHLHLLVKENLSDENTEDEVTEYVKNNPDCIIICDEIGNGIVPMDKKEREYRERTGRLLIRLAREADEVERIICGIPQKIK